MIDMRGHLTVTVPVRIVRARRGRVTVEFEGQRVMVRSGETLKVKANVDIAPTPARDDEEGMGTRKEWVP